MTEPQQLHYVAQAQELRSGSRKYKLLCQSDPNWIPLWWEYPREYVVSPVDGEVQYCGRIFDERDAYGNVIARYEMVLVIGTDGNLHHYVFYHEPPANAPSQWFYGMREYMPPRSSPTPVPSPSPTNFKLRVSLDDKVAFDEGSSFSPIINDVAPEIRIEVKNNDGTIDGAEDFKLTLYNTSNNSSVPLNPESLRFEASTSSLIYTVPFEAETYFKPGDQYFDVEVSNGSRTTSQRVNFSVFAKTLYSGTPVNNAYRIAAVQQELQEYPLPPTAIAFRQSHPNVTIVEADPSEFYKAFKDKVYDLPRFKVYLLRAGKVGSAAAPLMIVFLDDARSDFLTYMTEGIFVKVTTPQLGDVFVLPSDWTHIKDGHPEVTGDILVEALNATKKELGRDYELWNSDRLRKTSLTLDALLLYKKYPFLFQVIIQKKGNGNNFVQTAYGSGIYPKFGDIWPSAFGSLTPGGLLDFQRRQWSAATNQVCVYNRQKGYRGNNRSAGYPNWLDGDILDGLKPYNIDRKRRKAEIIQNTRVYNIDELNAASPYNPFAIK